MGDHSHINNDTHRLPHIWPYIFTPLHQPQTPVFAKNCHPKSYFCHTPEFWKFFTQRPLMSWNLRKRYPNAAYFFLWPLSLKDPLFFCLAYTCLFEGNVAPSNTVRSWKNFVFSKQNRAIWWILSGANLIKVMKIKFQFYRLNRPNCALYGWISLEGRDDIQAIIHLVKHGRGYILQTPSINLHPWLSKQMPSVSEDVRAEAF